MKHWRLEGTFLVYIKHDYDVPLQYIFTEEILANWVQHLSAKQWCTPEVIDEFFTAASAWMIQHQKQKVPT
jgi:hypothetical protein